RGRIVLLALDGEGRAPRDDHVELLVAAFLAMLLDHPFASLVGGVGVHPEGADVEVTADRSPHQAILSLDRERLELADAHHAPAHVCDRSASSTTGSTRSTPSTRSSRFSLPAHAKKVSPS